ncbi:MAG: ribosome recycling factor [Chitinophagaceae bacterium]|nr:ribosome recycling factor [Chitinophagaceae bacterium]
MNDIDIYIEEAKESMEKSVTHTRTELSKIRAGKSQVSMLDGVHVLYYGIKTPLNQVASITTPDARTLFIKPFEKGMMGEIEKSIKNSDLGFNPQNNGEYVIISIPILTEERRRSLVKQAKNEVEQGKISIRNIRKEINEEIRKLLKEGFSEDEVKNAEEEIQKLTDTSIARLEKIFATKEAEIMTV